MGTSLWFHALLLAAAVSIVVALGQPGVAYFSDEGAAVLQAQVLVDTGEWQYVSPLRSLGEDPDLSPFVRGDRNANGVAPYAKHPLYPLLLAGVGPHDVPAMLALSVAGTVLASVGAALLARRSLGAGRGAQLIVLWTVGLGSPLLFDSGLILAHTIAAALVVFGVLAFVAARSARGGRLALAAATGGLLLAGASMLRTEALFVGPAVALALAIVDRRRLRHIAPIALTAGASSVAAWWIDRAWSDRIVGDRVPGGGPLESSGWLVDRFRGAGTTLLRTTNLDLGVADVLLWVSLVVLIAGLLAWRWASRVDLLIFGSAFVVVVWVARLWADPSALVPGLLVAFPVAVGATVLALLPERDRREARFVWLVVAFAAGAVLSTQYGIGGGVEWGGRYFALLLPLWAGVAVPGAMERLRPVGAVSLRLLGGFLVLVIGLSSLSIVTAQRHAHRLTQGTLDGIESAASELGAGTMPLGDTRGVVVSDNRLLPQIAYTEFDQYAWVVGRPTVLPEGFEHLASMGIEAAVVVTPNVSMFEDITADVGWSLTPYRSVGSYEVLIARMDQANARS